MSDDRDDGPESLGPFLSRLLSRAGATGHGTADRWVGTRELPGYRAGDVVVRLADLPGVDARHLYLDVLLLDERGRTADTLSGPCHALRRDEALDRRSELVRIVAELLRDAPDPLLGLAPLGPVLAFVRQYGVDASALQAAAQMLDRICSPAAVAAQLERMLLLSIGEEESMVLLERLLGELAAEGRWASPTGLDMLDLENRLGALIAVVGKARARDLLRERADFPLLPTGEMFGL